MAVKRMQVRQYIWQVSRRLSCPAGRKRQIMANIRAGIREFLQENPEADMAAVTARFGAPEQIAESYLSEIDPKELQKALNIRKRIFTVFLITALAALTMWAIAVVIASIDAHKSAEAYGEFIVNQGEARPLH